MELRYVLITLLKILISTPNVLLLYNINEVYSAALMGGHLDNRNSSSVNVTDAYYEYDFTDSQELEEREDVQTEVSKTEKTKSEDIPDPSPLVLPGYNLPENIFNQGKPFYVEKDPLTGKIDFSHKSPTLKEYDLYEYVDEEPSDNIYDKSNIDRKDGSITGHKPSDVNQLTPNFHDFLNLPVKYNPDKYVYPLISSSYSSTKVQGSVNKFHNHKGYNMKTTTTKRPTASPTYFSTNKFFHPTKLISTPSTTTTMATTTAVIKRYPSLDSTPNPINLMNSEMSHSSFNEEFEYYDEPSTTMKQTEASNIYITTKGTDNIYITSKPSVTTKRTLSLFEQLFGEYDETIPTTVRTVPTKVNSVSTEKSKNNHKNTEIPTSTTSAPIDKYHHYQNAHAGPNILTGSSNMGLESNYEYEDYGTGKYDDNIAVESSPIKNIEDDLRIEPLKTEQKEPVGTNNNRDKSTESTTAKHITTNYNEYDFEEKEATTIASTTTTTSTTTMKPTQYKYTTTSTTVPTMIVTSLPLGENHVTNPNRDSLSHDPIIVATQNLREKLNNEKIIPKPFEKHVLEPLMSEGQHTQPPSTSNIHIAPDQDMVSFVVGQHQNVDSGQYVGTAIKESPYDSNPFRPLYGQEQTYNNGGHSNVVAETEPQAVKPTMGQSYPEVVGSAVTIQPLKNSEASLAIGVPVNGVQVPGQVVDEKLEFNKNPIDYPKGTGSKIVFPSEKQPEFPDLIPPPAQAPPMKIPLPNRDILPLGSKLVYHQLPSDLTPPKETEVLPPIRKDHRPIRPPWDPRPGHFHTGKPEYNRPPRPQPEMSYKRIDNLPNILPQFRPNMNKHIPPPVHYLSNKLMRQPLLERPSNRPIGFFEKLLPPPPPPSFPVHKNIQNLRKGLPPVNPPRQSLDDTQVAQDRIINEGSRKPVHHSDQFGFYQTPPPIKIANRRSGNDIAEVETLQMIQAKNAEKTEKIESEATSEKSQVVTIAAENALRDTTEKSIYKVYPVNTPPIKLDVIDDANKETVVIGTRAELPLPPSQINKDYIHEQNPLFDLKDRNDAPILKPHPRPSTFPVKSEFPYPLERPDPAVIHPAVPETPSNTGNGLDDTSNKFSEESTYLSNNQWNTIGENLESRIVNGHKINSQNQISATLKTYTEKPIAVAYTPTEPNLNADKYSMPNYGSPVIPEIRPGTVENADTGHSRNEFTVNAVMHTHHHRISDNVPKDSNKRMDEFTQNQNVNHKSDIDTPDYPKLDFEAPFQASVNVDHSISQGWSIVKNKNRTSTETPEHTTLSYATTGNFDIENFKPQLEGGFKPIYSFPDEKKQSESIPSEREE